MINQGNVIFCTIYDNNIAKRCQLAVQSEWILPRSAWYEHDACTERSFSLVIDMEYHDNSMSSVGHQRDVSGVPLHMD